MTLAERLHQAKLGRTLAPITLLAATLSVSAAYAQAPAATMSVLTPKQNETLGTTRFNLDVRFKSLNDSPVVTAELWVDGVRWVRRDLDSPRRASTLSFLVDGSTLSAGAHTIVVKVLNAEGNVSSAKVNVVAGSNDATGEDNYAGPEVRFVNPGNGKKLVGTVDLLVDAKSRNGSQPYVTFFVDDKFKTMKNYPPYSFTWDTTNETNGVHTITASGYLDSTNATTTRKITVVVNNPGGFTKRASEIPDLSAPRSATKAATVAKPLTIPLPKASVAPVSVPTGDAQIAESAAPALLAAASLGLETGNASASAAQTAAPRLAVPSAPAAAIVAPVKAVTVRVAPRLVSVAPDAVLVGTSEPTVAEVPIDDLLPADAFAALAESPVAASKNVSLAPRLSRPVITSVIAKATPRVVNTGTPAPKQVSLPVPTVTAAKVKAVRRPISQIGVKPVQVAFDGEKIAFDVAPRVEAGMPVAPFRQIFEHTGGKVSWVNDTKTMRAVNSDREIVIGVGKSSAIVNGKKVSMTRAASLDRGRTIVPLNFVGNALDVDVKYDPVTGRLSITSKN
ncbi:MAG: hypothetical protein H7Y38_01825 [Armatimonadetes bacterium]|nr:hypothetical protein [Armatimonadota bacterium]